MSDLKPLPFRNDDLGLGDEYVNRSNGTESSEEVLAIHKVRYAVEDLRDDVIEAFEQHDHDLRSVVEAVESKTRGLLWLAGIGTLVIAAALIWPRKRK